MSFAELKKIVGDNTEALDLIGALESNQDELVKSNNTLELKFKDVQESRDKVKGRLNLVKNTFGIDELTEDALLSVKRSNDGDKSLQLEVENLKNQLESANSKALSIEEQYKGELNQLKLDTELTRVGLAAKASSPETLELLKGLLKNGLDFETLTYKNPDGTTQYVDGSPMNLEAKLNSIRNNTAYAGLFIANNTSGGSGSNKQQTNGAQKSLKDMNEQERLGLLRTNPELFRQLVAQK